MTWNDKVGGWLPTCQTYPWQWGLQITPCFIEHRTSVFWTSLGSPWFTKRISQNKCHEGLSVRTLQFWWVFSCHCQPPMNINTYEYVWAKKETLTITKQMLKCPWLKPNVAQRAHCKQHLPMVQASLSLFLTCAFTWEHGPMGNQFNFFLGNWMAIEHCYGKSPCFKGTWSISWAFPASHSYVSVLEGMNFGFHHLSSFFTSKISPSLVEVPLIALDMRQLGHHDFTERTSPQGIPCFNQSLGHFSEMRVLPPWII